jgi:hypothetical protein
MDQTHSASSYPHFAHLSVSSFFNGVINFDILNTFTFETLLVWGPKTVSGGTNTFMHKAARTNNMGALKPIEVAHKTYKMG